MLAIFSVPAISYCFYSFFKNWFWRQCPGYHLIGVLQKSGQEKYSLRHMFKWNILYPFVDGSEEVIILIKYSTNNNVEGDV